MNTMVQRLRAKFRDDKGVATIYFVIMTVAFLAIVGLVVDGAGKVQANQQAYTTAASAARAAANAVSGQAISDGTTAIDSSRAVSAANGYLAAAGVGGSVAVSGDRINRHRRHRLLGHLPPRAVPRPSHSHRRADHPIGAPTMSIKRLAVAGIIAAALTLTACTGTGNPTPTGSPTNTPTPTPTVAPITGEAPADEDEAITKAQQTITLLLDVWEQVDATGGNSPELFDIVATGRMLSRVQEDASRTANGPILNEDGESIEGQATVEGRIEFEPTTAYGQEYEGIANGLVIVPG
ncbi:pilus assembly protein TadG-related protein, partial [Microbacterium sp. NRRL B-14842]|uniref:pilus assembly protein TadG-related protein n=1 Tax=Microbacterium sp. NRRL B-14842 TaxID=3162881 RepID=UPI003D2828F6